MKINFLHHPAVVILLMVTTIPLHGKQSDEDPSLKVEPPVLIDKTEFLYAAGDFFLAGQPEKETFDSLYSAGLKMVINIRTVEEMETHTVQAYDESEYVKAIGLDYVHVPVGGSAGFTPEAVAAINDAIKKARGKVLIHCRSAGRATLAWMAWLIRYDGYTIDQAVELGKKAQFSFPLEDLLGYGVTMKKAGKK